jgi:hypothetical protein
LRGINPARNEVGHVQDHIGPHTDQVPQTPKADHSAVDPLAPPNEPTLAGWPWDDWALCLSWVVVVFIQVDYGGKWNEIVLIEGFTEGSGSIGATNFCPLEDAIGMSPEGCSFP